MKWNALITTLSITLLYITKLFAIVIAVFALGFAISGNFEAPLGFTLDDGYRVEAYDESSSFLTAEYKGRTYSNVTIRPKSFYLDMGDFPISNYLMLTVMLVAISMVYFISDLLIKLLKSIENRDFFNFDNVKRIRIIGLIMISYSILKWVYSKVINYVLFDLFNIRGVVDVSNSVWNFDFFNSTLFLGLMILLVANAFEHGLKIKQEQDLTI